MLAALHCGPSDALHLSHPSLLAVCRLSEQLPGHPEFEDSKKVVSKSARISDKNFGTLQPEWKLTCAFYKQGAASGEGSSTADATATNAVFNEVKAQSVEIQGESVLNWLQRLQAQMDQLQAAPGGIPNETREADLAEWMERLDPEEPMVAGDLVECRSQRITKKITGRPGSTLFVISTNPAWTGHQQPAERKDRCERVAMLGRVPVRVAGDCPNNAYLIPSGESDGLACAVPKLGDVVEDQSVRAQCFGVVCAQLPPDSDGTRRVLAFVIANIGMPAFGELPAEILERSCLRSGHFTGGHADMKPRPYQEQCIERGIEANTIVNLPTGTGKTLVATRLVDLHLARSRRSNDCRRVLFTAPTRALVEQQADRCRQLCCPPVRLINLCSEELRVGSWGVKEWSSCLARFDILVGTPAIFVDALATHGYLALGAFSLLIFDEVHNATGGSPMASIMCDAYHPVAKRGGVCPRVLGLTASFVAGKVTHLDLKRTELETVMQANLYTPPALDDYVRGRREPIYHPVIYEDATPSGAEGLVESRVQSLIKSFEAIGAPGAVRDCEKTVRHATKVFEQIGMSGLTFYLSESVAYQLEVRATNLATKLADDPTNGEACRRKAKHLSQVLPHLRTKCREAAEQLSRNGALTSAPNVSSKCQALLTLIGDLFTAHREDDCYRGMIFVEEVALTFPLCHVLNHHLRGVCAQHGLPGSVCADAVSGVGSMSDAARNKACTSFASGACRVLVCTEAFLEGMDVPDCAFVVRFSEFHTTKSHIQGSGRARQEAADIYYFDNSITLAKEQAEKLAACARDTSLQLGMEERLDRIDLRRVPGIYPYTPVGMGPNISPMGTADVTIYNAPTIVQTYCQRVHGDSVDLEGMMSYGRASALAPMMLQSISYPAPGGRAVVQRADMLRYWGNVDFMNDVVDPARVKSRSKEDLEKLRFVFVVAVDMHRRGVLSPLNAPVARAVEEARSALGDTSAASSPHVLGSVLLKDVFAVNSHRVTDGNGTSGGPAAQETSTPASGHGASLSTAVASAPALSIRCDFKSELNLMAQKFGWSLRFDDLKVAEQTFRSTVIVNADQSFTGDVVIGKKPAQQSAAQVALAALRGQRGCASSSYTQ